MLKRDGLTENDLRKAAQQARQAAQLDQQLEAMRKQMQAAQQTAQSVQVPQQAQQAQPAQQPIVAPVMNQSGVQQQVDYAQLQAQQHFPQAPTISGGMFPAYGDQAQAVQPAPNQQKMQ